MVATIAQKAMSFLQSAEWETFQQALGRKTLRVAGELVIEHGLPFGFCYLYSPRPVFGVSGEVEFFLEEARRRAGEKVFLKVEPAHAIYVKGCSVKRSRNLQPRQTLFVDLSKTEGELFSEMHPKTRYNIRLAARRGVTVRKAEKSEAEQFFSMLSETAKRDGFHIHEEDHYRKLLEVSSADFCNSLFFAEYKGRALAAALVNFYRPEGAASYLHGASLRTYSEVMAPHLLHWEIIRLAKSQGFGFYDFWGIDGARWPGVTRFKTGFGGITATYPPAFDVVYRPFWYGAYRLAQAIRRF